MQVIHKTACKPIKGDSQAIHKPGKGKMYNTRKYTMLFTIHLQTLEVAKPTTA